MLAAAAVLALVGAGCAGPDRAAAPPEAEQFADSWPLPGGDYANTRAVRSLAITPSTVGRLKVAWTAPLPGASVYGNAATTPIAVGDDVLVQDLMSNVRSVDRRTGKVRWVRTFDRSQIGPNGVAVGWGKVFAGTGGTEVTAMDLRTGEVRWRTALPSNGTESVGIQPQVVGRKVLVSTVPVNPEKGGYLGGGRGVLFALDEADGRIDWKFDTVKGADLWGDPATNSGGGAWFPPAVDTRRGLVYWGTGNPAPFPGVPGKPNGSSRPGPNLYTNSVVALRVADGRLEWFHQATPHDLFDHDLMLTAIATTRTGEEVVVGTGKAGEVIGHDPETGEVRWRTPVGRHRNDDLTELDGPTEVLPGNLGGVISPPAVVGGDVVVAVANIPTTYSPATPALDPPELGKLPGEVVSVDAASGRVRWTTELPGDPLGGVLAVGDVLFTATFDGTLYGLDRTNGDIVWRFTAPGGVNGWPAVSHDTIYWPVGVGKDPVLLALAIDGRPGK